jgi:predicted secreted protein
MKVPITIVYSILLAWGYWVGIRQIQQGFRRPGELLNPLFANRVAITMFAVHIAVVSVVLFGIGPWAVTHKSTLWFWGGVIALMTASLPIAAFFNRNPQSFGHLIGGWVKLRNFFEYGLFIAFAAAPVNWFRYYILLWWLVAYRYLDVGPRRALQRLYNTPEKKAARPWAPVLNLGVIVSLYVLTFVVVYHHLVWFARMPVQGLPAHTPAHWEIAVVVGANLAVAMAMWLLIRRYTESLLTRSVDVVSSTAEVSTGVEHSPVVGSRAKSTY